MSGKNKLFVFFMCFWIVSLLLFETAEAGTAKKLAKNAIKAGVINSALGKKHGHHGRRGFPVWAIVLLVLGGSSSVGLCIFLYCIFRRQQFCFNPTPV